MTVKEICIILDADANAVNRAIARERLTCVYAKDAHSRFVAPDKKFKSWIPEANVQRMIRRRLKIMKKHLKSASSLEDAFYCASLDEEDRFGVPAKYKNQSLQSFLRHRLDNPPQTLSEWKESINELIERHERS